MLFNGYDVYSSVDVNKTGTYSSNGSENFSFQFLVVSWGFSASINIGIFKDELEKFRDDLNKLIAGDINQVVLREMPDFEVTVGPDDPLGHFSLRFKIADSFRQNSADLAVILETQSLLDFATALS